MAMRERLSLASCLRSVGMSCLIAAALTYLSLVVPGRVIAVCGNLGTPIYCPVLAYGFPLPFLADSRSTSPTGSVARDPLSIVIGQDDVLWAPLGLSALFWMAVVMVVSRLASRRRAMKRRSQKEGSTSV